MRRILKWFSLSLLAASLVAIPRTEGATRTPRETIAYVPAAIWGDYLESATAGLVLRPHAIYWYEGADSSMGQPLGDFERYQADDAKAAPREPLVAFAGRYAAYPSNTLVPGVAVMDTTGALVADFPRGQSYAWSPDGQRLAVLFSRDPLPRARGGRAASGVRPAKVAARYRPGVSVWDRRDGSVRSFQRWPSRAAWAGDDSLLLQFRDSVLVLDPRSGKTARTGHNGTIVSPDFRYAIWPGEGGEGTRILHEESGERITDAVFGPFQREEKPQIRSAFWMRGRGADHLMVVCGCDGIQYPEPSCRTRVIDVETGAIAKSFRGEALGPTADERGVIVFRRDRGRLEYHDLRPVVRQLASDGGTRPRDLNEPETTRPGDLNEPETTRPRDLNEPEAKEPATPSEAGEFH